MKRFLAIALAASLGLVMAGTVSAAVTPSTTGTFYGNYAAGQAASGIGQSRHNLGGFGDHVTSDNTTEICIFCHTPHHTNTAKSPIWNRGDAGVTLAAYGTTIAGSNGSLQASSLACLSCHDGVTTFDNIVNAPGKAGVTVGGTQLGWTFHDGGPATNIGTSPSFNSIDNTSGPVNNITGPNSGIADGGWKRLNIGGAGNNLNAYLPGSGLSDDHPMGVTYMAGQRASLRPTNTIINDIDLAGDLAVSATNGSAPFGINMGQNLWSVSGFISNTATISQLLRNGKVECASCHDPHFNNKSWTEVESTWAGGAPDSNGLFLRRVQGNSGSGVCRTCHEK